MLFVGFVYDLLREVVKNAGEYEQIPISAWQIRIILNNLYLYISQCLVCKS